MLLSTRLQMKEEQHRRKRIAAWDSLYLKMSCIKLYIA